MKMLPADITCSGKLFRVFTTLTEEHHNGML